MDRPWKRKFLGYSFWVAPKKTIRCRVAPQSLEAMKDRVREITARNGGRSMRTVIGELREYLPGWKQYFRLAETPKILRELDSSHLIRHPDHAAGSGANRSDAEGGAEVRRWRVDFR